MKYEVVKKKWNSVQEPKLYEHIEDETKSNNLIKNKCYIY